MSTLKIGEGITAQYPMVAHASNVGWIPIDRHEALRLRGGDSNMLFARLLESKILEFNPWLNPDQARSIVETIDALPNNIEGNWKVLNWLRGERQWYDEADQTMKAVQLVDFANPDRNTLQVTWEWDYKPPARKGNRADVVFVVNGVPVAIVEHKNPTSGDALERGVKQLRRYQLETPELIAPVQLHNISHMLGYWYGVTWNINRKFIFKWKYAEDETYQSAVEAFFEPHAFLRTLKDWIQFYVEDSEVRKTVLREHQRIAIDKILERCLDENKKRGLIWHTQGSGKTFTLLTAARLILGDKERFGNATVMLVVDRNELEGQLKDWVEKLLGEMHSNDIVIRYADSKKDLQNIFDSDYRGLVISMIHKFDKIKENFSLRDNIYIFIDEAHRSVAKDLGTYLMAAAPNATIIGFTGTPVGDSTASGSFKIFGRDDPKGFLDKYSILESIADGTTLPIQFKLAPSTMRLSEEQLDNEFYSLAGEEGVTDIEELNKVLERAVTLRTFLGANDRVEKIAEFVAKHYRENILPLGYKAFVVAVDRETCAKYKMAIDKHLPPEWSEVIYSKNPNDVVDRKDVARLQVSPDQEKAIRRAFKQPDQEPKILIVTDKLLTGYDAPVLGVMYLDKPMRNHVLLQTLARVNRPYVDGEGIQKKTGLVIDFVGVLENMKKALAFEAGSVDGALEDLEILMVDLHRRIDTAVAEYLQSDSTLMADAQLEALVYGRFVDKEERKKFYEEYKLIQNLWEILSPDPKLRDYIQPYTDLSKLYAAVRANYASDSSYLGDLEYKTRKLIQDNATMEGLDKFSKVIDFNETGLSVIYENADPPEAKAYNLRRGLGKEIEDDPANAVLLQSITAKADSIIANLEDRKINGLTAISELEKLVKEKEELLAAAESEGLSKRGAAIAQELKRVVGYDYSYFGASQQIEVLLDEHPHWKHNPDERRRLRTRMYGPLRDVDKELRATAVDSVMSVLEQVS